MSRVTDLTGQGSPVGLDWPIWHCGARRDWSGRSPRPGAGQVVRATVAAGTVGSRRRCRPERFVVDPGGPAEFGSGVGGGGGGGRAGVGVGRAGRFGRASGCGGGDRGPFRCAGDFDVGGGRSGVPAECDSEGSRFWSGDPGCGCVSSPRSVARQLWVWRGGVCGVGFWVQRGPGCDRPVRLVAVAVAVGVGVGVGDVGTPGRGCLLRAGWADRVVPAGGGGD